MEHPVTELVTGIDLVRQQLLIAAGSKLHYRQEEIQPRGAAIECRIYAEDPHKSFFPAPGTVTTYFEPSGPGIRTDSGVCAGSVIPVEYDPLISKVIALGEDREQAIGRMRRALGEYKIGGVPTTLPFFEVLLSHPAFLKGDLHTHFCRRAPINRASGRGVGKRVTPFPLIAAALNYFFEAQQPKSRSHGQRSLWKNYLRYSDPFRKW